MIPIDFSSQEVTNGGTTRAQTIEVTMVSADTDTNNDEMYNLIDIKQNNTNPSAFQTINCEITRVKRQKTTAEEVGKGLENEIEDPATIDNTTSQ